MKGPDFEIPPDLPAPPPVPPVSDVPAVRRPWPARAAAAVALLATSAAGAFAWYSQSGPTRDRPAVVSTSTPTRATARAVPAPTSSTSTVAPAPRARTVVRTCLASADDPGAVQGSSPDWVPWITFDFSPRVAADALRLISDAASEARQTLGETSPFIVHVHCDVNEYAASTNTAVEDARRNIDNGRVAHVRRREMWIYGPAFGTAAQSTQRRAVYHEYFHVLQGFLSDDRSARSDVNTPMWLLEGSASYFASTVRPGDLESERRMQLRRWDSLPALRELEVTDGSAVIGASGAAYTLGFVASDYLVTKYGRDRLRHDFWVAVGETDWRSAFLHVFGLTAEEFYADFEAYRATLRP